MQVDAIRRRR